MNRKSAGRILFPIALIFSCPLALLGCPNQTILTEINRCLYLNQKIDAAEALLDQLDEKMAIADGYRTYQVGRRVYNFASANGQPLKTLVYYPEDKTDPSPVVLFSHGLGGSAESQLYLFKALARRGNIAIAPDHIDYVNYDRIGLIDSELKSLDKKSDIVNGLAYIIIRLIESEMKPSPNFLGDLGNLTPEQFAAMVESGEMLQLFYGNFNYRLDDMRVLLGLLPEMNAADPILCGRLDLDKIVMSGHSLGGSTTLALALQENPFKAIICLSPASHPFSQENLSRIRVPILYMSGDGDTFHDEVVRAYNYSPAPKMYQSVKNGGHTIFNDLLFLYGLGIPFLSEGEVGFTDNLPIAEKSLIGITLDVDYPLQLSDYQGKALTIAKTVCAFVAAYASDDAASLALLPRTADNPLIFESFLE